MAADKLRVNIFDLVASIARVIDMMSPIVGNHHLQVAYLVYRLGEELQLSDDKNFELFIAGALHDIGAFSLQDRLDLLEFEDTKPGEHSKAGSLILETFKPFSSIGRLIKYHHVHWKNGEGAFQNGESVPIGRVHRPVPSPELPHESLDDVAKRWIWGRLGATGSEFPPWYCPSARREQKTGRR